MKPRNKMPGEERKEGEKNYSVERCLYNLTGLCGKLREQRCLLSGIDVGEGIRDYDVCGFGGEDYRDCPLFKEAEKEHGK